MFYKFTLINITRGKEIAPITFKAIIYKVSNINVAIRTVKYALSLFDFGFITKMTNITGAILISFASNIRIIKTLLILDIFFDEKMYWLSFAFLKRVFFLLNIFLFLALEKNNIRIAITARDSLPGAIVIQDLPFERIIIGKD